MQEPLRAILFDVFGTVVDWRASLIRELTTYGAAHGLHADWAGLVDAWRGAYEPEKDRVRGGGIPWTNLDALHRHALDDLLPRFGLATLDEDARAHLTRAWHRLDPWPDALPGLARLHGRFILGPLSNGNVSLLVNMARRARLPWDMVFSVELFRRYKPDPATYLGACALLDLAPTQVMMCAAHNGDLRAASALGLRTGFVRRANEYGPGQHSDLVAEEAWDVVAEDLEDLATQLGV